MLRITIPATEQWDERKQEFISTKECSLQLEHSLVSLSKWESKWHKPFLGKDEKTEEEIIDYVRCMTITQNVDPTVYYALNAKNVQAIKDYIDDPMTATTFRETGGKSNNEIITAELIYYWMVALQIPFECQKWHLNKLLTLIRVCNIKNQPDKKMDPKQVMKQNAALNAARRKKMNTKG